MSIWKRLMNSLLPTEQPHLRSKATIRKNGIISLTDVFPMVRSVSKVKNKVKAYTFTNGDFIVFNDTHYHCRSTSCAKGEKAELINAIRKGYSGIAFADQGGTPQEFYKRWKKDSKVIARHC